MNNNLPVKNRDDFFADAEVMDLNPIKNETFLVAISMGDRDYPKFMSSTVHGPYSFYEMVEEVNAMWVEQQLHAKAIICSKDRKKAIKCLDANTIDYIEAHAQDILMDAMLEGAFDDGKEYTCAVGIIEEDPANDPRTAPKQQDPQDDAP